jgi:hypothetical protein
MVGREGGGGGEAQEGVSSVLHTCIVSGYRMINNTRKVEKSNGKGGAKKKKKDRDSFLYINYLG